jgi:hypothetical protein
LPRAGELLDSIAQEVGVWPLSHFFSISTEALTGFAADHRVDSQELRRVPTEEWFLPEQGLMTLRPLMEAATNRRISDDIVNDLKDFQAVLQTAAANGVRWHLAVDF